MRSYLAKMREEKKMTQHDVAKAVGVSRQYYQMIETGNRQKKMDVTLCVKLADVLGVSVVDIINEESKLS